MTYSANITHDGDKRIIKYTDINPFTGLVNVIDTLDSGFTPDARQSYRALYHCGLVDDTGAVIVPESVKQLHQQLFVDGLTVESNVFMSPGYSTSRLIYSLFIHQVLLMTHTDLYIGITLTDEEMNNKPDGLAIPLYNNVRLNDKIIETLLNFFNREKYKPKMTGYDLLRVVN